MKTTAKTNRIKKSASHIMDPKYKPVIRAAELAGKIHLKNFGKNIKTTQKSTSADFQTKSDIEGEKAILKTLKKYFPKYNILAEESKYIDKKSDYTFIIDPLDGTLNFIFGSAYFGVIISLMYKDEIIFAVTNYPHTGVTYWAQKGKGAYKGNKRIHVNDENDIKKSTVMYTSAYKTPLPESKKIIGSLFDLKVKRIIQNWAPSIEYCFFAEGKIEAVINNDNEIYDRSAGRLIAREAGAMITDFNGKRDIDTNNKFLVSNGTGIHKKILKIL